ncbi:MAG TPA: benzoate-CoA ligase family protein [Candidatus Lustribacter sp.]
MEWYNAASDLLDRHLPARAQRAAFIDERCTLTYGELATRVDRAGGALRALGIQPEHRVVLALLDTVDFPIAFLGAIKAGIVPIPVNTLFPAEDYAYILADSRAQAVIVSIELLPKLREAAGIAGWSGTFVVSDPDGSGVIGDARRFADLVATSSSLPAAFPSRRDDACFWLYSSGSTGRPKGTVHVQTSMLQTADLFARDILGFSESDIVFSAAKLFFAYGLGNALSFPLAAGATSVLVAGRVTPDVVCDVLARHKPTIFCGVPTLFNACLLHPALPKAGEHALRLCTSAGEVLPEEIGRTWTERTGVEIIDGIGSTEMLHIFVSNRPGKVRYGTTGTPVPGYRARIIDEHGAEAAPGDVGELEVAGPTAAMFYWNNREKSRHTFAGEWTRTGDKFYLDSDGNYVHCGRTDDMLKVGGIWVSPSEVEGALIAHEQVLECAVIGCADENALIKPKAFIVLMPGVVPDPALSEVLKNHVKSRLAPYKYPRWIEFIDALPKTATGKIQRHVLRAREAAARA